MKLDKIEKDRRNGYRFTIYTDASYNQTTKNGAGAYVIIDNEKETMESKTIEYRNANGSTDIELNTILIATCHIHDRENDSKVKLLTDSLASVSMLQTYKNTNAKRGILKRINKVQEEALNNLNIIIGHVKGHSGDEYNNICDRLAVATRKQMDSVLTA